MIAETLFLRGQPETVVARLGNESGIEQLAIHGCGKSRYPSRSNGSTMTVMISAFQMPVVLIR